MQLAPIFILNHICHVRELFPLQLAIVSASAMILTHQEGKHGDSFVQASQKYPFQGIRNVLCSYLFRNEHITRAG